MIVKMPVITSLIIMCLSFSGCASCPSMPANTFWGNKKPLIGVAVDWPNETFRFELLTSSGEIKNIDPQFIKRMTDFSKNYDAQANRLTFIALQKQLVSGADDQDPFDICSLRHNFSTKQKNLVLSFKFLVLN